MTAPSRPVTCRGSIASKVRAAYRRIADVDRPEVWIHLREEEDAVAEAMRVERADLPLAGLLIAVKDNIDVAGMPTTAGAPSFAHLPVSDAPAVARLRDAGAVVLGKTNLDQFATGLVGTRSPYGAVRNAWDPQRISGGSSAGSAVAVALGLVDAALGTDTAGSGRVPAALNGLVGLKPTRGLVPTAGVVPACRTLDCVTVFAGDMALARKVLDVITSDPRQIAEARFGEPSVGTGGGAALTDGAHVRLGVPRPDQLGTLAPGWSEAFSGVVDRFAADGFEIVEIDIAPMLEAARMLYESALVAQRYEAVGAFIETHRSQIGDELDPTVSRIVLDSRRWNAVDLLEAQGRLRELGVEVARRMEGTTALLTPTTTRHPTVAEVAADPVGVNADLGRFTNFANLLDMAAVAVPGGSVGGLPFGVMLTGPAGTDPVLAEIGGRLE
jgi:allophanate hydrolase